MLFVTILLYAGGDLGVQTLPSTFSLGLSKAQSSGRSISLQVSITVLILSYVKLELIN